MRGPGRPDYEPGRPVTIGTIAGGPHVMPGGPHVKPGQPDFMPGASVTDINNLIENIILPSLINNNQLILNHIRHPNNSLLDIIDESILIKLIVMGIMILKNNALYDELPDEIINRVLIRNDHSNNIGRIKTFLQNHLIPIRNLLITNNDTSMGGKSRNKRDNKRIRSKTNRHKTIRRRKNKTNRHKNIRHKTIRRKER